MDDHERYGRYVAALDAGDPGVLAHAAADPDRATAGAFVVPAVERAASSTGTSARFESWTGEHDPVLSGFPYARERAGEWLLLLRLSEGAPLPPAGVTGMSDWLQRRLAGTSTSAEILSALAAEGRTRRVRAAARTRSDAR